MNLCTSCGCETADGTENMPVATMTLAIATVPIQPWEQPYDPATGLQHGTIFPCLDLPFFVTGGEK